MLFFFFFFNEQSCFAASFHGKTSVRRGDLQRWRPHSSDPRSFSSNKLALMRLTEAASHISAICLIMGHLYSLGQRFYFPLGLHGHCLLPSDTASVSEGALANTVMIGKRTFCFVLMYYLANISVVFAFRFRMFCWF